ncbi:MAG: helicase-related protein, partial [Propionibacteriaceae bacterium]
PLLTPVPNILPSGVDESRLVRDDARNPRGRSGRGKQGSRSLYGGQANPRFAGRSAFTTSRRDMVDALGKAKLLPAICFVFSRTGCDAAVRQLLGCYTDLTTDYEKREIDILLGQYTARLSDEDLRALDFDWFAEGLRRGIAAHHAGLLPAFKECVEAAFVRGLIKIVFATDTLALGINMPAKSVVIEKLTKYNGETHADITPGEYTQLTGRAGRRGIDVDGHAIVVWQPGVEPRAVAGLASKRTYPLRSSFSPTYNMAANLVGAVGRDRARGLLEQSFAQFQSDRSVVGVARRLQHLDHDVATAWAQVHCDQGDFEHYARLRGEISASEAQIAHERKADRRAETYTILQDLAPGDLVYIPSGKKRGWAAVVANPRGQRGELHLSVMTLTRQIVKAGLVDFPTPPVLGGKIRVPKYFDVRDASSRRAVAAALQARLPQLTEPSRWKDAPVDDDTEARLLSARVELRAHPCHACPDRELHARAAEQALRLEREARALRAQADSRTQTIARKFDKICLVLEALGYLDEDGRHVTDEGRMLARIYNELDLVAAQALRLGVFDGLTGPQLAAVLSTLVYESRTDGTLHRMPDRASEKAQSALRAVRREVGLLERDHRLERGRELDIGFAEAVYAWAAGDDLADVLTQSGLVAGDFVRWVRQVIDFCGQIGDAAGPGSVRDAARTAVRQLRRGVVDVDTDQ